MLARSLAPLLYLQPDETFQLARVVAVVHPRRRVVGYHLLWRDDAHGAWIPFTIPTDEEVIWVGYDEQARATELWTYWHGVILHADWRTKGRPAADIQWGKHGSLPRHTRLDDLPVGRRLAAYYVMSWVLPDLWLGALNRPGPVCFCGSYRRYRLFSERLDTANRLDAVVRTDDPRATLRALFGRRYSDKPLWPAGALADRH